MSIIFNKAKLIRKAGGDFLLWVGKNKYIDIFESLKTVNGQTIQGQGNIEIIPSDDALLEARISSMEEYVEAIAEQVGGLNRLPIVPAVNAALQDVASVVTGDVLSAATDPDGDELFVAAVTHGGVSRSTGVQFSGTYGSWRIDRDGAYAFTPNGLARALLIGASVTESVTFTVEDAAGGRRSNQLTVTITGTNSPPLAASDTAVSTAAASSQSGNVLTNDSDDEGSPLSVVSFTVDGIDGTFLAGQQATIPLYGSITISANGQWTRTRTGSEQAGTIVVRYKVTDGTDESTGILSIVLQGGLVNASSNPITIAMAGTRTFNVGPGQTYAEVNDVPWASLMPGDVVNIHHRPSPYVCKFGIAVQGEASAQVIINGVTDANGNRPVLDGNGATNSPGSMPGGALNIWAAGDEGFGLITIKRRPGTTSAANPRWITIQNLRITGARADAMYTDSLGATKNYGFSAGIWVQPATDITIRNCVIDDNAMGIFTMSKPGGIGESCQRVRVLYNRIYGNGVVGSSYEHGCYIQGYDVLTEGNYLGRNRAGAQGSTYKSRVGKEVIRYNWIESSARMIDMVHPEFTDAFVQYQDFGVDYVYGNVLVNDENLQGNAWRPIHFGSDGSEGGGEWEGSGTASPNHRKKLYFYSNTYFHRSNYDQADQFFLQLSWPETVCEAWGNIIVFRGSIARLNLLYLAGTLNLRGSNIIVGYTTILDASSVRGATSTSHAVNRLGTVITADPQFVAESYHDFALAAGSPGIDIFSALPAGVPASVGTDHPVQAEPLPKTNGLVLRAANIGATDLGAMERDPSAPPRVAPVVAQGPVLDPSGIYAPGNRVSVIDPTWLYNPTSVVRQWERNTGAGWTDTPGGTGTDQDLTEGDIGQIRVRYEATNIVGTTVAYSDVRTVTNATAAPIIQIASGVDSWPSATQTCEAAFPSPPAIGHLLVAFVMVGSGIGDNFGNAWVLREDIDSGYGSRRYQMYTCTVTSTGADFKVTGSSNGQDVSSIVVYELAGAYVSSVGNAQGAGGTDGDISITASAANQRLIAGFSSGRAWGNEGPTLANPWLTGASFLLSQVDPPQTVVHGVSSAPGAVTISGGYSGQQYLVKIAALIGD